MSNRTPSRRAVRMWRFGLLVVLGVACVAIPAAQAQPDGFVRVEEGRFVVDGHPYYFTGTNFWHGLYLGSEGVHGDRQRLLRELDRLAGLGIDNLRVMASSEGPDTEPMRVKPAVQPEPGVYDEELLRGLDFLLAEMAKRDMRAVLVLNNFFMWSGGMAQYVSWATGTPIPYPSVEQGGASWDDYQRYAAQFYADAQAQKLFLDLINELVHRENHITGVLYRDDPTIMAWQLANEPRGFGYSDAYVEWVDRAAGFLQLIDPNHLVSLGGEGKLTEHERTQFERVARSPHLDYLTIHIWIENWGWFDPKRPEETFPTAVGRAMGYLADHLTLARALGKPVVVEEFGASRDGGRFESTAGTTYRDRYYRILLEALYKLALEGNAVGGSNVWSWSGEAVPQHPGRPWQPGEPLTGDPPHEMQGWYAIYAGDESTQALLAHYARLMKELRVPAAQAAD